MQWLRVAGEMWVQFLAGHSGLSAAAVQVTAAGWIQSLAWELLYAANVVKKLKKKSCLCVSLIDRLWESPGATIMKGGARGNSEKHPSVKWSMAVGWGKQEVNLQVTEKYHLIQSSYLFHETFSSFWKGLPPDLDFKWDLSLMVSMITKISKEPTRKQLPKI